MHMRSGGTVVPVLAALALASVLVSCDGVPTGGESGLPARSGQQPGGAMPALGRGPSLESSPTGVATMSTDLSSSPRRPAGFLDRVPPLPGTPAPTAAASAPASGTPIGGAAPATAAAPPTSTATPDQARSALAQVIDVLSQVMGAPAALATPAPAPALSTDEPAPARPSPTPPRLPPPAQSSPPPPAAPTATAVPARPATDPVQWTATETVPLEAMQYFVYFVTLEIGARVEQVVQVDGVGKDLQVFVVGPQEAVVVTPRSITGTATLSYTAGAVGQYYLWLDDRGRTAPVGTKQVRVTTTVR